MPAASRAADPPVGIVIRHGAAPAPSSRLRAFLWQLSPAPDDDEPAARAAPPPHPRE